LEGSPQVIFTRLFSPAIAKKSSCPRLVFTGFTNQFVTVRPHPAFRFLPLFDHPENPVHPV
jgi:hypothetical protein